MSATSGAAHGPSRVAVLVAAAGAPWEAEALDHLERGAGVVLSRRCVDLTDLLAAASTGLAGVAVVSPALAGLDADSVDALRRARLGVVLVGTPDQLRDGDADRMRRLGIEHLIDSSQLAALPDRVRSAGVDQAPRQSADLPDDTEPAAPGPAAGRVVAVWGPTGAPGRTTVAVGLAAEVARLGHEAFLLDVDPYGGAVAQHLGVLDEVSGLLAAARAANSGLLDVDRLSGLARQVDVRLRVLTGLPRPDRWPEVRPAAYADLLEQAARLAEYVVLDAGFCLEAPVADPFAAAASHRNLMTLAAVQEADEVVVVGAADPVGLARLARGLVELRDLVPGVRPRVVVNRTRPSLGWSDREIQGMVEGFVTPTDVHFVPDDRPAADRALMAGQSLAESGDSLMRAALAAVAGALVGEPPAGSARRVRRRRAGRAR